MAWRAQGCYELVLECLVWQDTMPNLQNLNTGFLFQGLQHASVDYWKISYSNYHVRQQVHVFTSVTQKVGTRDIWIASSLVGHKLFVSFIRGPTGDNFPILPQVHFLKSYATPPSLFMKESVIQLHLYFWYLCWRFWSSYTVTLLLKSLTACSGIPHCIQKFF